MYFKRLELNGFKSFADPTVIEFTEGITCIVGPNGSGKSNISDAIRWVLGEQSPKMLRGGKMEEVIFAGTQNRKAKGMAEVTLVIDNSDHSLPIDYTEVAITRRMYRSGDSEYLINKNICRLKDIRELLMDTGIGVEGYSIIGQGKIADIVSNKMDSRREIFEEAAGVVKYKTKKEEAERKLEAADLNLSRVNDIVNEIEGRIDGLKEDSEKATEYLEIREKATDVEINIILKNIEQSEQKSNAVKEEIDELAKFISDSETEKANLDTALHQKRSESYALDEQLSNLRIELSKRVDELYELSSREEVNKEKRLGFEADIERINNEIQLIDERLNKEQSNADDQKRVAEEAEKLAKSLEQKLSEKQEATQKAIQDLEDANAKLSDAILKAESIKIEQGKLSARLSLLDELEKSYEGYNGGVKFLMEKRVIGIIGTLGELLVVPKGYELAIETVLGGKLQNIVCKNDGVASIAIGLLKEHKAGRLTFLPIDNLKVQTPLSVKQFEGKKGFIGLASDMVKCEGGYQQIVDYVLGNVVICDTLENALRLSHENNGPHKFVTLEGEVVNAAGALTGGSLKNNTSNILARKAEKTDLEKQLKEDAKALITANQNIADARALVESLSDGSQRDEETNVRIEHNEALLKVKNAKELESMILAGIEELKQERSSKETNLNSAKIQIQQIDDFSSSSVEIISSKESERKETEDKLSSAEANKLELQKAIEETENAITVNSDKLYEYQNKKHDAEVRQARFETQTENYKEKLWEDYELSYAQALEHEDPEFVLSRALKESREYKERLRQLGDVNVGAIEEYKQVSERYEFLTTQRADILKAIDELKTVISDMDTVIRERFTENFDKVVLNFESTFNELFKGGHAQLIMDDPAHPLESAIEINAQPPGKKLQNMNLLSGGEKTLTAIALMFAVLKSKPTPFCILDEIEAALDEANIDTVASYIRSFGDTQFALITHQKLTMEYADVLYGVTMPESGVTKVLSLKLGDDFEVE